MISQVWSLNKAPRRVDIAELYVRALRYVMEGKEERAAYALNTVRDTLLENGHSSNLTDAHMQTIMPDLTVSKFMALYGDYKHNEEPRKARLFNEFPRKVQTSTWDPISTPWIRQPELLDMITSHIAQLGDDDDRGTSKLFLQRTRAHFSIKRPAIDLVA